MSKFLSACAFLATVAGGALAQERPFSGFSLGIGAAGGTSIYEGADTEGRLVPFLSYESEVFAIGADGAELRVLKTDGIEGFLLAAPRFSPFDGVDSSALSGMDRDTAGELGAGVTFEIAPGTALRLRALADVTDVHDGQQVSVEIARRIGSLGLPVIGTVGARWQSSELATHLYGVKAAEAQAGRPSYDPGDVIVPGVGLQTFLPLGPNVRLIGSARIEAFPDAVTDSPIIDDRTRLSIFSGIVYAF